MKLTELLEQIDRLDQEAEAAPWGHEPAVNTQDGWSLGTVRSDRTGESVAPEVYDPDGAFIALARTALPAMSKALRAVMAIHKPFEWSFGYDPITSCKFCADINMSPEEIEYPCPTVSLILEVINEI